MQRAHLCAPLAVSCCFAAQWHCLLLAVSVVGGGHLKADGNLEISEAASRRDAEARPAVSNAIRRCPYLHLPSPVIARNVVSLARAYRDEIA